MNSNTLLVDLIRPATRRSSLVYNVAIILAASIFVAVCAQLAFDLPFSPVPVTGQTFAVLLVGALLGSRRGALALIAYAAEGAAGLPVFAMGRAGAAVLFGPTGGYIFGFIIAAWLVGMLAEKGWDRRFPAAVLAMSLGTAIIFLFGASWLTPVVGADKVFALGVFPFLPGAAVKIVVAAVLLPACWKLLGMRRR